MITVVVFEGPSSNADTLSRSLVRVNEKLSSSSGSPSSMTGIVLHLVEPILDPIPKIRLKVEFVKSVGSVLCTMSCR